MIGWQLHLMYAAVGAIVIAIVLVVAFRKKATYDEEARGSVLADIWLPSGRSLRVVTKPTSDGWLRLGKLGDYKLATVKRVCDCGHDENDHVRPDPEKKAVRCQVKGCECTKFEEARAIPAVRRWAKYPMNPFLGLKLLQTDIRSESFWLNNPEPITPSENRTKITAVDAQVHTREIEGETVAIQIQQMESQQKQLASAIANQPNKMVVYVMLGINILVAVINLVQYLGMNGV